MSSSTGNPPACVVIGRNEGERLARCLKSLIEQTQSDWIVYVDSGSTDSSVSLAKGLGIEVVELDMSVPFTAARARNAGYGRLKELHQSFEFVQFIDGDCELIEDWLSVACAELEGADGLAVVFGTQSERFPNRTFWNRLINHEWEGEARETDACGGNAMIRRQALDQVGGYRDDLIAGEEPELCYRMRQKGWRILRLNAGMALHDADMRRISQWWQRNRRAGHAFAEVSALHRAEPERFWVTETRRALIWGAGVPLAAGLGALMLTPGMIGLLLAWPAQMARLWAQGMPWEQAVFLTLGKIPEARGVLDFWISRIVRQPKGLIEYK